MDNETTTKNLVAAVAERDRRIAELTALLVDATGRFAVTETRLAGLEAALHTAVTLLDGRTLAGSERTAFRSQIDDALSGGDLALDAVVAAAVAEERVAWAIAFADAAGFGSGLQAPLAPEAVKACVGLVVAASLASERAAIRARVELERPAFPKSPNADIANEVIDRVLRYAIDASEGGAS